MRLTLLLLSFLLAGCAEARVPLEQINLPPGFRITIFANVPDARSLSLSDKGTVFVGTRRDDKVYALADRDGDGRAESIRIIASGLEMPNGVAFHDGALYVAENHRIIRFANIESQLDKTEFRYSIIRDDLPTHPHHGWRYIAFGPDGKLYISIGAPGNVCEKPGFARIKRMNPDGSGFEDYALGVRNSVGMDWHPETDVLWFTDNGRDMLGDDLPPDELNRAPRKGLHFGFPYCHGGTIPDPEFGKLRSCTEFVPPAMPLGPHVASLGMRFYTGSNFPENYRQQILIAEHGSWNRSTPIGYRVSLITVENGQATEYQTFVDGWLQGEKAWGRPVDVLIMPDGAMLVSDDKAGVIYRIWFDADSDIESSTPRH